MVATQITQQGWVQASILLYISIYMHTFSRRPLHTLYWYLIMLASVQIPVPMWWYVPAVVVLNNFLSLFMSSKSILIYRYPVSQEKLPGVPGTVLCMHITDQCHQNWYNKCSWDIDTWLLQIYVEGRKSILGPQNLSPSRRWNCASTFGRWPGVKCSVKYLSIYGYSTAYGSMFVLTKMCGNFIEPLGQRIISIVLMINKYPN
jgi:hypothetical protein